MCHSGQILAVVNGNSNISFVNAYTSKVINQLDCSKQSSSNISCLGWGVNFVHAKTLEGRLRDSSELLDIEDVISRNPKISAIDPPIDLPLELTLIDVEGSLPKLPPLSSGGFE